MPPPVAGAGDSFQLSCAATTRAYTYTATGVADKGMASFVYTIDESGARTTVSVPGGWIRTADCWTFRPDGSCV
jgi:hypothetical protein